MTEVAIAFPLVVAMVLVVFATRVPAARVPGVLAAIALGAVHPLALHAWARFTGAWPDDAPAGPSSAAYLFVYSGIAPLVAFVAVGFARQARCDPARRVVAWLVTIAAYGVVLVSAHRQARLDPEDYRFALPIEATLEPGAGAVGIGSIRLAIGTVASPSGGRECALRVEGRQRIERRLSPGFRGACPMTRVRHDARSGLAIVETVPLWRAGPTNDAGWAVEGAYATQDGRAVVFDPHAAGRSLRVPLGWTIAAGVAVAIALVLLGWAHWLRARARIAERLEPAMHDGDGWFELGDGRRVRERAASSLPVGAALVALVPAGDVAYRANAVARVRHALGGTKARLVTDACDMAASLESIALTVAALGATPAAAALSAMT